MPDISMCLNIDCPIRSDCYRYTAKPDEYQTYSKFEFIESDTKIGCNYFWYNGGVLGGKIEDSSS